MIIGIAGPIQAGKTTLAHKLAGVTGCQVDSLANPLKETVSALLGEPVDKNKSYRMGHCGRAMTGREILQVVGSAMRKWNPDVFLDMTLVRCFDAGEPDTIIDDVRYPNESMACRKLIYLCGAESGDPHESESHQAYLRDAADMVLTRDGDEYYMGGREITPAEIAGALTQGE